MNNNRCLFGFDDDLTSENTANIKGQIIKLIDGGCLHLDLELKNVANADVAGINMLASIYKILLMQGGTMEITLCPDGNLARLLQLTKFNKILTLIYEQKL